MSSSRFDSLSSFIRRRHRVIIIAWVIVVAISLAFIPSFFNSVSYNITGGIGGPTNTESQKAANILTAQFPGSSNGSTTSVLLVFQGANVYSDPVKNAVIALNSTVATDGKIANYTGTDSVYTTENGLLNSTVPALLPQVSKLQSSLEQLDNSMHSVQNNFENLSSSIFQLQSGINETARLVYGIPNAFVEIWEGVQAQGITDPLVANQMANATIYRQTNNFGGLNESLGYYRAFYEAWNESFASLPNSTTPVERESSAISEAVSEFSSTPGINSQTKQIFSLVSTGLNTTTYNDPKAIENLTVTTTASSIPNSLSTSLGVAPTSLVQNLYNLGPSPSQTDLANYTKSIFVASVEKNSTNSSIDPNSLVDSAYDLGTNYTSSQSRSLASQFISNSTQSSFASSPLFVVNGTSLASFLGKLPANATSNEISISINDLIANTSYNDYPFVPTSAITHSLVSKDNQTEIIIFNFSYAPSANEIDQFRADVHNSQLSNLGATYVTGSTVISQDLQNAFTPALSITIGPGVAISILIVGLLFLSPIAALIPVMMGGISVTIALSAIYVGIVKIDKGNITFLTPTLTILLILGLAVDYAVLQLRRTREERVNGNSTHDSVGISVRWAGQAVLTAGITVIVAYIVMAVANVPLFSDVGTAIALGVSILLAASLTLLPAIEIAMGDRIFWPGLKQRHVGSKSQKETRLQKLARATLRRKVLIATAISLIALAAVYTTYNTPTGEDFLRLIPNFSSNQGLTVIGNSLGSGTIAPTTIILTTPTPIVYGDNQFNQTLLDQIEQISNAAANTSGTVSVTGPTRPYGAPFDYSQLDNLSEAIRLQYLGGMISQIGKNNKTALINVGLSSSSESQQAINTLLKIEGNVRNVPLLQGEAIYFGGDTQSTYDSHTFLTGLLPEVIVILAIAVYFILFLQLRSAFTPLRLIFTILCSVVFSLSIISIVFYHLLNLPILDFAPLFVVVTMLGVGIDYDIFFVTRIREEVLKGKSDNDAIVTAVDRVWVTILGLGLVLSTVFASLLITGIPILQEISLAVSSAILVDVLVVILFFVPSLMGLAQRLNWWPTKIQRNLERERPVEPKIESS